MDLPIPGERPVRRLAVQISGQGRRASRRANFPSGHMSRSAVVNVMFCTSQRQSRRPYPHEVMLNGEDGMDWETFCDCSCMYAVKSFDLFGKRGRVTLERRRQIRATIRSVFLLSASD